MSTTNVLGLLQVLLVIPKIWLAVRQPQRRTWHIVTGAAIGLLGCMMLKGR